MVSAKDKKTTSNKAAKGTLVEKSGKMRDGKTANQVDTDITPECRGKQNKKSTKKGQQAPEQPQEQKSDQVSDTTSEDGLKVEQQRYQYVFDSKPKKKKSAKKDRTADQQAQQQNPDPTMQRTSREERKKCVFFHRPNAVNGIFCQWYLCDMTDEEGRTWNCCEQYYMWYKAATFNDTAAMDKIRAQKDPGKQKGLGRKVKDFDEARWNEIKYDILVRGNMLKFSQGKPRSEDTFTCEPRDAKADPMLMDLLLATGSRILAEASPFDKRCGIGFTAEDAVNVPREQWGENLLGKALMDVRALLQAENEDEKERELNRSTCEPKMDPKDGSAGDSIEN